MIRLVFAVVVMAITSSAAQAQTRTYSRIDCVQSEIVLPRYSGCQRSNYYSSDAHGESALGELYDQIAVHRDAVADTYIVLKRSRHQGGGFVYSVASREALMARLIRDVVAKGADFSGEIRVSNGHIRTFRMSGLTCFLFVRDAPYKGTSIEHILYGYQCGRTAEWHDHAYAARFMASVAITPPK